MVGTIPLKKMSLVTKIDLMTIYILALLAHEYTCADISNILGMSAAGISMKLKRVNQYVGNVYYLDRTRIHKSSLLVFTEQGRELALNCCKALDALEIPYLPAS